ncbi:MAG: hypothetical protein ACXV5Q_17165, partial [Frankiaceae bacterium]
MNTSPAFVQLLAVAAVSNLLIVALLVAQWTRDVGFRVPESGCPETRRRRSPHMKIQVNTDSNIDGNAELTQHVEAEFETVLSRFGDRLTRVEVHLRDDVAGRSDGTDIRCLVEARPARQQPVAVTHHGATPEEAYSGAAQKLKEPAGEQLRSPGRPQGSRVHPSQGSTRGAALIRTRPPRPWISAWPSAVRLVLAADTEIAGHFRKFSRLGPLLAGVIKANPESIDGPRLHDAAHTVVRPHLETLRNGGLVHLMTPTRCLSPSPR